MTIAIGLISKGVKQQPSRQGAIIFCSDSQGTYGAAKRTNPNKISIVDFEDAQILVAVADSIEAGDKVVETMRRMAKDMPLDTKEAGVQIAQRAMREVRNHLKDWYKDGEIDDDRLFWTEYPLNLLVGYYFQGEPFLYKIGIRSGIYSRIDSFEAIGGGKDIGYFLLKEYSQSDPDFEGGYPAAISVVERAIDSVDGCNRPTWVGVCYRTPDAVLQQYEIISRNQKAHKQNADKPLFKCEAKVFTQEEIGWVIDELKDQKVKFKSHQKSQMLDVLAGAWKRRWKWAEKENERILAEAEAEMKRRGIKIPE